MTMSPSPNAHHSVLIARACKQSQARSKTLTHDLLSLAPETLAYSTHEAIEGRKILVKQLRRDGRKKLLEQTWLLQMRNRDEADEMTVEVGGEGRSIGECAT